MHIDFDADYTMTIDGAAVETENHLDVINPATEASIASAPDASQAQLDAAVAAARVAFPAWAARPLAERQALVVSLAERLLAHVDEFVALLTREQGKPLMQARQEVMAAVHWLMEFSKMAPPEITIEDTPAHLVQVKHTPLGVVAGIVPWNFPVLLAVWKIGPALVTGNTMILKPSPFTPLTMLKLGELTRGLLPDGVFNVISGGDALGPWMSLHSGIDKIAFTGSTATGRRVMESAARNLKRITLELGGNDAAIVMPDVDVPTVAEALFWAAFVNSGQVCIAAKRMYIHEDIYDELSSAIVAYAKNITMGDGFTEGTALGPIQNRLQFDRVCSLLQDARSSGLKFLLGGEMPKRECGYFFPVTIVDNPPDDARVVREEAFGPLLPLLKFKDIDDVVARANDSEYGLAGSVWSQDLTQAQAIAERLHTGTVWINEIHALSPHAPLAGHKQSGFGVENSLAGLLEYTHPKTITVRRAT